MSVVVNQPYSTAGNGGRKLVRLSNGKEIAGVKDTSGRVRLYVSGTSPWPQLLQSNHIEVIDFALVAQGNDMGVLMSIGSAIAFQKYDVNGNRLVDKYIDTNQNIVGNVSLAIDPSNGHLHAAWSSTNSQYLSASNIRYAKSTDGGATWNSAEQVTLIANGLIQMKDPTIVVVNGSPLIFFTRSQTNGHQINYAYPNEEGGLWEGYAGTKYVIYGGAYAQSNPSAVVDKDGVIHVAWHGQSSDSGGYINIYYAKSLDGGISWSSAEKVLKGGWNESAGRNESFSFPSITTDKTTDIFIAFSGYKNLAVQRKGSTSWDLSDLSQTDLFSYPSTLLDPHFSGEFGNIPSMIYEEYYQSVDYIGTYTVNQEPTLTIKDDANNPINEDGTVVIPRESSLVVKITASDEDDDQTLQYRVRINSKNSVDFTSIEKNEETVVEIGHWLFYSGMNSVEIAARDSEGGEVTITFNVIVDENLPIDSSSLANMKFNGYSLSTISLAELVNFLE